MKRSDFYLRLTTGILFLAVVCYIGISLYNSFGTSLETAAAVTCTVEDTGDVEGYIVRDEFVVPGGGSGVSPIVRDGEKVAAGYVLATQYGGTDALRRAAELRELKLLIEQLESLGASGSAYGAAAHSVTELSGLLKSSRLYGLDAALIRTESLVMTGVSSLTVADLPALRERLAVLQSQSAGDATVHAPVSGVYSQVVDGYEGVGPEMLSGLTPTGLSALFEAPGATGGAGKLITGIRWYYAVTVELSETRRMPVGKEVQVRFKGEYQGVQTMTVDSVGRGEGGRCVVVLSCASAIAEVCRARYIEAEIVFDTFTGIRVPKEAIHLGDDGRTYVYLKTGAQSEKAEVTILTEFGDSYVAVNAGTKPLLREGASIIVKANDLENGKAVLT